MTASPLKIMIVDDEPPIRKLLRMGLGTQGYDVLEAANGKIALELLAQDPALIILDLGLPDIQGHDLLRMIRGRNDSVPIVVLSRRGDETSIADPWRAPGVSIGRSRRRPGAPHRQGRRQRRQAVSQRIRFVAD